MRQVTIGKSSHKASATGKPEIKPNGIVDVRFGKRVKIIEPVNLYGCTIEDDCFIGPFTEIQKNASVGKRTRIQSHSFICELVTIGSDCFIAHGVMFVNDLFSKGRPSKDIRDWRPTLIGNHVSIGTNATILPVRIVDNVVVGAGAVVTKDILEAGIYAGNPAVRIRKL